MHEALKGAYALQNGIGLRSTNILALMQRRQISADTAPPFQHPDLCNLDWLAQASFTIQAARRALAPYQRDLLDAYYLPAHNDKLTARKEDALRKFCLFYADAISVHDVTKWFLVDIGRRWVKLPYQQPMYHWVQKTGKSERTLRTIANGDRKRGILGLKVEFQYQLETARAKASDQMFSEGIVYA